MSAINQIASDNSTTNRWQILSSLVAFSVLMVLTFWALLVVTNPDDGLGSGNQSITGTVISTSMGNTSSTNVSIEADVAFSKQVTLVNPVTNGNVSVTYSGLIPKDTQVNVATASTESNEAGDLTIENAEFKLFLTIEWEDVPATEIEKGNLVTITNQQSAGILRLNSPDASSTTEYSYFRSISLDQCDGIEANSICVAFGLPFGDINLTAKCQVQQVTGLRECDQVMSNLKVAMQ